MRIWWSRKQNKNNIDYKLFVLFTLIMCEKPWVDNVRKTLSSGRMDGWMEGWMDGWKDGWMDGKAGLRIAYSNQQQLLSIITSNYYSILYYNAPSLSPQLKQKILSASAAPLKLTTSNYNYMMSFDSMHYVNLRATPPQFTTHIHALLLRKIYNVDTTTNEWLDLFFNKQFNQRELEIWDLNKIYFW